jgi:hypothetical protein
MVSETFKEENEKTNMPRRYMRIKRHYKKVGRKKVLVRGHLRKVS